MAVALASLSLFPSASVRSLGELLELVHELPAGATGELVVGEDDEPLGSIFVEGGRVCWAAARGLGQRLIDILARTATRPLDPQTVEAVYRRCRASNVPFGEKLVDEGMISRDELRAALRKHTLESCAVLAGGPSRSRWLERASGGYSALFTYSTTELLVTAGALGNASRAAAGRRELERVGGLRSSGIAFARDAGFGEPTAIAAIEADSMKPSAISTLGRWAADALDVAAAVTPTVRFHVASTEAGRSVLTWEKDVVAHVMLLTDLAALSRALVMLVRDEAGS